MKFTYCLKLITEYLYTTHADFYTELLAINRIMLSGDVYY